MCVYIHIHIYTVHLYIYTHTIEAPSCKMSPTGLGWVTSRLLSLLLLLLLVLLNVTLKSLLHGRAEARHVQVSRLGVV